MKYSDPTRLYHTYITLGHYKTMDPRKLKTLMVRVQNSLPNRYNKGKGATPDQKQERISEIIKLCNKAIKQDKAIYQL